MLGEHTVRILRADGPLRILSLRGVVYHAPDGRPRAAAGIVLDVTDREQMAAALRTERRRQWGPLEVLQSWANSALYVGGQRVASPETLSLTGMSQEAFRANCDHVVAPDDRARMRAHIQAMIAAGKSFEVPKQWVMAGGDRSEFRFLYTPVRDAEGRTEAWATDAAPTGGPVAPVGDGGHRGLMQEIEGSHLRAARALLGWSMQDLAQAGGLSFATVRRLEEEGEGGRRAHSREMAVAALQRAGIGFQIVEGDRVAVFRR